MPIQRIVIFLGSATDMPFAKRIEAYLKEMKLRLECEYRINSAHRNPEKLLDDLKTYEKSKDKIVYVTVAGLSDSLSSVVAGYTTNPVIACPPDLKEHGFPKLFSTVMTPRGIAVALVPEPENAALAAAKIFALSNPSLKAFLVKNKEKLKEGVERADAELIEGKPPELEEKKPQHEKYM